MAIKREWLYFLLAAVLISAFFHFRSPNIPDPDSLYHLRHAQLLRTNGIFNTEFPWTYYSAIRTEGADLWYGFHLFLMPFASIKIAGVFLTALLLLSFYWVGQRQKFSLVAFWPFLFLLAVPNALFQVLMVRPQLLTLGFSAMLLSVLAGGGPFWAVFLLATAITFFHISFFWLAPGIAFLNLVIRFWLNQSASGLIARPDLRGKSGLGQKNDWQKGVMDFGTVLAGTALGMILRPEPLAALKLVYIQVVKLLVEKQSALPLLFSRELSPLSFSGLIKSAPFFLLLWLMGIVIFNWLSIKANPQKDISLEQKRFLWLSGILSLGFFLMTLFVARRSLMFWPGFGTLFIAGTYSFFPYKKFNKDLFLAIILIGFLIMAPVTLYQNAVSMRQNAMPPNNLREAAEWLKENSQRGDIVFNSHWDNFAPLFFWNQRDYYIGGMDPIFQYAYDSELYWQFHHISKDEYGNLTCGELECYNSNLEDIHTVLKEDFKAKYAFVEKKRNPAFFQAMDIDSRFEKKFDNSKEMVFLVK